MSGGSIYIDPDSVSYVSSQIGMTAEQLDSLRQTIVPRVNEVISMSYPSIQEMPNIAYPLNSSQDNIEAFNYRVQILVEDLRITSSKLNQIAESGRMMNEILLRQSTLFGSTGTGSVQRTLPRSGAASGFTWKFPNWKTLVNEANTFVGAGASLIVRLNKLKVFKDIIPLRKFATFLNNPYTKLSLALGGAIVDYKTGDKQNIKTSASDIIGALVGLGVGAFDGGDLVLFALGVMQLEISVSGNIQGWLANQYPQGSVVNEALGRTSAGLLDTAKKDNVGQVFDDIGALTIDGYLGASQWKTNDDGGHVSYVTWGTTFSDTMHLLNDTTNTLSSIKQGEIDISAMALEDSGLSLNYLIQNSPLPSSWKSVSKSITPFGIQDVSNVANYITQNPEMMSLLPF